ncbi:hypothetical protein CAEBREN_20423 [Caenorhabditis brenneri]|uniref:Glycosyltransferase family 92 protein n=1 Tax=Caenorhabditis brenneri TaxID=135651 RepID=G0MRL8_CAEBE|nr:hypothetical protein CAEBREN_20423 [Caenorhabditis brenneri]
MYLMVVRNFKGCVNLAYEFQGISEFCVLFLGVKCYSNISKQLSVTSGTSKFSANLQKQLFNALVIQTIVPVVSMYLPIFVFFFCPMLSLNMGYSSRFISDCKSWYPAINSLPSMIVVKNYRRAIMAYKYEFSFCMAPIYGQEPKWLLISEIIEHYKLQGVTHFYIYVFHITEYDNAILQDYVRTGEVDVTFLLERDDRETFYWQHVAYRDCTLRSRHESKWSLVADIDERLLMTKYPGTILDYLRSIKDEKIGAVQFRQQWVLKTETMPEKYEGEKQIDAWSPTLRWHNSSAYGPLGHTAKCIIMAEKVFSMGTHYPKIYFPGFELYYLETDEGIVRHYRDQKMWDWGERYLEETLSFGELRMTDYPEKYQKNLTDAVKRRTKYVYENYHVRDN